MKYIIFDMVNGVGDFPVLFPEIVAHHVVGNAFGGAKNILSAGYVRASADSGGVLCECYKGSRNYPDKPIRALVDEAIIEKGIRFEG